MNLDDVIRKNTTLLSFTQGTRQLKCVFPHIPPRYTPYCTPSHRYCTPTHPNPYTPLPLHHHNYPMSHTSMTSMSTYTWCIVWIEVSTFLRGTRRKHNPYAYVWFMYLALGLRTPATDANSSKLLPIPPPPPGSVQPDVAITGRYVSVQADSYIMRENSLSGESADCVSHMDKNVIDQMKAIRRAASDLCKSCIQHDGSQ